VARVADVINLGAAHATTDSLIFAAGDSTLDTSAKTPGFGGTGSTMDTVNNFVTNTDKIDLSLLVLTNAQQVMIDEGSAATVTAMATAAAQAGFFIDGGGVTRAVAQMDVGADTYLFVDANKSGVFDAGDLVVKFAGISAVGLHQTDILGN